MLNLLRKSEQVNWGIDVQLIEETARKKGVVYLQCPIRWFSQLKIHQLLMIKGYVGFLGLKTNTALSSWIKQRHWELSFIIERKVSKLMLYKLHNKKQLWPPLQGCRHSGSEAEATICSRSVASNAAAITSCICDMHKWPWTLSIMCDRIFALDSGCEFAAGLWICHCHASLWSWPVSHMLPPHCCCWAFRKKWY